MAPAVGAECLGSLVFPCSTSAVEDPRAALAAWHSSVSIKDRKSVHEWCHGERRSQAGVLQGGTVAVTPPGRCRLGPSAVCPAGLQAQEQPEEPSGQHSEFSRWFLGVWKATETP